MSWPFVILTIILACILTEVFAWAVHRYVMHSWGWGWHKSHHEHGHEGPFERNDLFALIFAAIAIAMLLLGQIGPAWEWVFWSGIGVCIYGVFYVIVHDVLTHGRLPFAWLPKDGYLRRLIEAHHLHHASQSREDCVSYGFLYAPPLARLRAELRARRMRRDRPNESTR